MRKAPSELPFPLLRLDTCGVEWEGQLRGGFAASGPCMEWQGPRDRAGYGVWSFQGRPVRAHRLSYTLTKGAIPPKLVVCHACDNPPCVNPDHLWIGTVADNVNDCILKGRHFRGRIVRPVRPLR